MPLDPGPARAMKIGYSIITAQMLFFVVFLIICARLIFPSPIWKCLCIASVVAEPLTILVLWLYSKYA